MALASLVGPTDFGAAVLLVAVVAVAAVSVATVVVVVVLVVVVVVDVVTVVTVVVVVHAGTFSTHVACTTNSGRAQNVSIKSTNAMNQHPGVRKGAGTRELV